MKVHSNKAAGFSLVELVIVIVIIGIIAAIAVPRISRGAKGAVESAVRGDVAALRAAVDLYAAEHNGVFPGMNTLAGVAGTGVAADFVAQLTTFSDISGKTGAFNATTKIIYGPYLRNGLPPLPIGANAGSTDVLFGTASPPAVSEGTGEGWVYNKATGELRANTVAKDESLANYSDY